MLVVAATVKALTRPLDAFFYNSLANLAARSFVFAVDGHDFVGSSKAAAADVPTYPVATAVAFPEDSAVALLVTSQRLPSFLLHSYAVVSFSLFSSAGSSQVRVDPSRYAIWIGFAESSRRRADLQHWREWLTITWAASSAASNSNVGVHEVLVAFAAAHQSQGGHLETAHRVVAKIPS